MITKFMNEAGRAAFGNPETNPRVVPFIDSILKGLGSMVFGGGGGGPMMGPR